jgi:hypothetical protein
MTIDITMVIIVVWILALMCSGFCLLILSFPLLLYLLGSVLVFFLFESIWLSFLDPKISFT